MVLRRQAPSRGSARALPPTRRRQRQDEAEAHELGIEGVSFFVLGGRYAISGAQQAELLLQGIEQAWREVEAKSVTLGEGAVCGPEGCE